MWRGRPRRRSSGRQPSGAAAKPLPPSSTHTATGCTATPLYLLGNVHDAQDVTAGAFLELWRRRNAVRLVEGSVLPWLLVTTSNLSRNTRRHLRRHRAFIRGLARSEPVEGAGEAAEAQLETARSTSEIGKALRSLSRPDAALLAMTAFEGLSPSQAAEALGISPAAARTRLHRARNRMANALRTPQAESLGIRAREEPR